MKRVASHCIYLPDFGYLHQMVIELEQGVVTGIAPLLGEPADTSWLPGVIVLLPAPDVAWRFLSPDDFPCVAVAPQRAEQIRQLSIGRRAAYCAAFDFSRWQAVGGTPHIQWL